MDPASEIDFNRGPLKDHFNGFSKVIGDPEEIEVAIWNRQGSFTSARRLTVEVRKAELKDCEPLTRVLPGGATRVDPVFALSDETSVHFFCQNPLQIHSPRPANNRLLGCDTDRVFGTDRYSPEAKMIYDDVAVWSDLRGFMTNTAILTKNTLGIPPIEAPGTTIHGKVLLPRSISIMVDPILVKYLGEKQRELFGEGGSFERLIEIDRCAAFATLLMVARTADAILQDLLRRAQEHGLTIPYMSLEIATKCLKSRDVLGRKLHEALKEISTEEREQMSKIAQEVSQNHIIKIENVPGKWEHMVRKWHSFETWDVSNPDWTPLDVYPDEWAEQID